jgi:DNA-binding Lrp family transcriptional regulator
MKNIKIDDINANILKALLINARTSFTEMAEYNHISVVSVRNRYERLKQIGVIKGAIFQINPYCLGFNCNGFLALTVKEDKHEEIIEFLKEKPYILSSWKRLNEKNIGAFFTTPDLEYFNSLQDELKNNKDIEKIESTIFVGFLVNDHPDKLIINRDITIAEEDNKKRVPTNNEVVNKKYIQTLELRQMNRIDRRIAKALSKNARVSFRKIAKELKISTSNVINRYNNMKKNNLLIRSTVSVNLEKLGYKGRMLIYFNIKRGTDISELQDRLLKLPNLIVLVKTLGKIDMLAILPVSTFEDFFEIKKTFNSISEIEVVNIELSPPGAVWPYNYYANLL